MFNLNDSEKEVLKHVSSHLNEDDLLHTLGVVNKVKKISKEENLSEEETEILVLAAYFHDSTKRDSIKEHHLTSAAESKNYLNRKKYPYASEVAEIIKSHSFPIKRFHDDKIENPRPSTKLQLLLIKADMLAQLEIEGQSLMFVKNLKKGLSFDENLGDIKIAVADAEKNLKWAEEMLTK